MSELKNTRIDEVAAQYPLIPKNLFSPAVSEAGLLDSDYLAGIVSAYQAGSEGRVDRQAAENAAEIQTLKEAYATAKARGDGGAMVALKSRVFALGGGPI
jgi:hypothetical protein